MWGLADGREQIWLAEKYGGKKGEPSAASFFPQRSRETGSHLYFSVLAVEHFINSALWSIIKPHVGCVTLGKSLNIPELLFLYE